MKLELSSKGDAYVKHLMDIHYSHPGGFVGRQVIYKIRDDENRLAGAIAGGSATQHLPGRNEFFGDEFELQNIINNTFYHLVPNGDRNLGTKVLKMWREKVVLDWQKLYESPVIGFETLVELPRTGSVYKADNWTYVGTTKGYTCRRVGSDDEHEQSESWGGVRVWNYEDLRPKLVFCRMLMKKDRVPVRLSKRKLF